MSAPPYEHLNDEQLLKICNDITTDTSTDLGKAVGVLTRASNEVTQSLNSLEGCVRLTEKAIQAEKVATDAAEKVSQEAKKYIEENRYFKQAKDLRDKAEASTDTEEIARLEGRAELKEQRAKLAFGKAVGTNKQNSAQDELRKATQNVADLRARQRAAETARDCAADKHRLARAQLCQTMRQVHSRRQEHAKTTQKQAEEERRKQAEEALLQEAFQREETNRKRAIEARRRSTEQEAQQREEYTRKSLEAHQRRQAAAIMETRYREEMVRERIEEGRRKTQEEAEQRDVLNVWEEIARNQQERRTQEETRALREQVQQEAQRKEEHSKEALTHLPADVSQAESFDLLQRIMRRIKVEYQFLGLTDGFFRGQKAWLAPGQLGFIEAVLAVTVSMSLTDVCTNSTVKGWVQQTAKLLAPQAASTTSTVQGLTEWILKNELHMSQTGDVQFREYQAAKKSAKDVKKKRKLAADDDEAAKRLRKS